MNFIVASRLGPVSSDLGGGGASFSSCAAAAVMVRTTKQIVIRQRFINSSLLEGVRFATATAKLNGVQQSLGYAVSYLVIFEPPSYRSAITVSQPPMRLLLFLICVARVHGLICGHQEVQDEKGGVFVGMRRYDLNFLHLAKGKGDVTIVNNLALGWIDLDQYPIRWVSFGFQLVLNELHGDFQARAVIGRLGRRIFLFLRPRRTRDQ